MRKNFVIMLLGAAALTACNSSEGPLGGDFGHVPTIALLTLSTPPINTIAFGKCEDEIAMPDSRRGNCDLYYKIRKKQSPWAQRQAAAQAATYQPGELRCIRTLGGRSECETLGPLRAEPVLLTPNTLGSQ